MASKAIANERIGFKLALEPGIALNGNDNLLGLNGTKIVV
jgi:hypothetical protein